MRAWTRNSLGILATIGLAACSFGDGGSTDVSLKSEADIIREVANVTALAGGDGGSASGSDASARQPGARGLVAASRLGRDGGVAPKAGQTVPCSQGSYVQEDFVGAPHDLP